MATEKLIQLVAALIRNTKAGKASWTVGSREDTFIWSGSSASVAVSSADNDGRRPWVVTIIDSEGRVVEEEIFDHTSFDLEKVEHLYDLARADALDIDATINGLLGDLDG